MWVRVKYGPALFTGGDVNGAALVEDKHAFGGRRLRRQLLGTWPCGCGMDKGQQMRGAKCRGSCVRALPVPGSISQEMRGAREGDLNMEQASPWYPCHGGEGTASVPAGSGRAGRQTLPLLHQRCLGLWACRRPPQCRHLQCGHVTLPVSHPPRGLSLHRLMTEGRVLEGTGTSPLGGTSVSWGPRGEGTSC